MPPAPDPDEDRTPKPPEAPARAAAQPVTPQPIRLQSRLQRRRLQGEAGRSEAADALSTQEDQAEAALEAAVAQLDDDLIATCEAELAAEPDAARAARLHFELGRAVTDEQQALGHFKKALQLVPTHLPSIREARRLLLGTGLVKLALPLYDSEIRLCKSPAARAVLLYERGRALQDSGDDPKGARKCFAQAIELDSSNPTILRALEECEYELEDWKQLQRAQALEANAVEPDSRHRAAIVVQRAKLLETRLGSIEEATELYSTALKIDPEAAGATQALKRLYFEQQRWHDLINLLEREATRTTDADVQAMAFFQIARLHSERLGNRHEAIGALIRALGLSRHDQLIVQELVKLYEASDDSAGLARALQSLVGTIDEPAERLGVLQRVGEVFDQQHGDSIAASPWYEAALAIDATYSPALRALERIYAEEERWDVLIAMLLSAASASKEPLKRADVHARVAEILEVRLGKTKEAIEHHARALGLAPDLDVSFKALCRLYGQSGFCRELVELYERAIDRSSEQDVIIAYLFKIGMLYEDSLNDPDLASQAYRRILQRDPKNLGAIHSLQRVAERGCRYPVLVEALLLEASLASDQSRIVGLLHRAGDILYEKMGDRHTAVSHFRKVLKLKPDHVPALNSLARLLERMGHYDDLLEVLGQELEVTADKQAKVALLLRMGELVERHLGDKKRALAFFRRAVAISPLHSEASTALQQRLRSRGEFDELAKVLRAQLEAQTEPAVQARAAFLLGEVEEVHLKRLNKAVEAYRRADELCPGYRPATDGLTRVRAALKSWDKLAEALVLEAASVNDTRLAIDALLRAGQIRTDQLGDKTKAISAYEAVLDLDPHSITALLSLEPLYRSTGKPDRLADVYEAQAEVFKHPPAQVAALEQLARLLDREDDVTEEHRLRKTLQTLLSYDAGNLTALRILERLALVNDDQDLLMVVDKSLVERDRDSEMAAAHNVRLGESLEQAGLYQEALAAFRAALKTDPDLVTAIRGLRRVGEQLGDGGAMVEGIRREAGWTSNDERASRLLIKSAEVRIERLGDKGGAVEDAKLALERSPADRQAAALLSRLLLDAKNVEGLIDLLSQAATAIGPSKAYRKAALWHQVGQLHADVRGDLPAGIAALERVLEAAPQRIPSLRLLSELYGRNGQWAKAAELLNRVVELGPSPDAFIDVHLLLARIFTQHLPDPQRALDHLDLVLDHDSEQREALILLTELFTAQGDHEEAAEAAKRLVNTSKSAAERASALLQLARLQLTTGDKQAAAKTLREAVALDGPAGEAAAEYKQLLGPKDEPWVRYAEALGAHLRLVGTGEVQDETLPLTYLELSQVQREKLDRPDEAIVTLTAGLAACDHSSVLGLELAESLARQGRHHDAIIEFQKLVAADPTSGAAWRGMTRTLQEQGRKDEASIVVMPLCVMELANDVERNLARQRRLRPGWARPGSFAAPTLQSITAGDAAEEERIALLFNSLGEAVSKLYPPRLEHYRVSVRDRLPERSEHSLRVLCDRLAGIFGIDRCDIYMHNVQGLDVNVEPGRPPVMYLPMYITQLPEAEQVFMLGRALTALARGLHVLNRLSRDELLGIITAAVRTVEPTFNGAGQHHEEALSNLQRRLLKALPWGGKRSLEQAATSYLAGGADVDAWLNSHDLTTARAAAILAGDLMACTEVLRRTTPTLTSLTGAKLIQSSAVLDHLLRFWACAGAMEFRRLAGIV